MRRIAFLLSLLIIVSRGLQAQPYMVTATNYASGFFGVVADENGQPLEAGSVIHLIWDSAGDGMDDPSVEPGSMGLPTDDDVLMGTGQVGITGGAPSAGTFVFSGTASTPDGWCYLRAFHSPTPTLETYYSESITLYDIPPMAEPVIYGIQFPTGMSRTLGDNPSVTVSTTPEDPPIMIGPTGGEFQYLLELHNNTTEAVLYDLWIDVILPDGTVYGPILTRLNLNMPGEATWTRQMTQSVPAGAPSGVYHYMAHAGDFNTGEIIHEDGFPFEKQGVSGSDGLPENMAGWTTTGWEDGELTTALVPDVFFLSPLYPNPFNPAAQIRFGLPEASPVRIDIYNILGSRVTTLMDRYLDAGYHSIVWQANNIASGLYLVQMKAGGFVHTEKALLLK